MTPPRESDTTAPDETAFGADYAISDPGDPFECRTGPFLAPVDDPADPRIVTLALPHHCNRSGVVHGGFLMTMADVVLSWEAVRGMENERAVTVSLNASFVSYAEKGDRIEARARLVRRAGTLSFLTCEITAAGRVVLTASGVMRRLKRDRTLDAGPGPTTRE